MTQVRLVVHTSDGETISVRTSATLRHLNDDRFAVDVPAALGCAGTPLKEVSLDGADVDVVVRNPGGGVTCYRMTATGAHAHGFWVELRRLPADSWPARGTPEVEGVFARAATYFDRLIRNGWADRSLGRFAPKYKDDEESEMAEAA